MGLALPVAIGVGLSYLPIEMIYAFTVMFGVIAICFAVIGIWEREAPGAGVAVLIVLMIASMWGRYLFVTVSFS